MPLARKVITTAPVNIRARVAHEIAVRFRNPHCAIAAMFPADQITSTASPNGIKVVGLYAPPNIDYYSHPFLFRIWMPFQGHTAMPPRHVWVCKTELLPNQLILWENLMGRQIARVLARIANSPLTRAEDHAGRIRTPDGQKLLEALDVVFRG